MALMSTPRPYLDFDKEIRSILRTIYGETPDLRVLTDFVKYLNVEILESRNHPERIGFQGTVTSCGMKENQLYLGINFDLPGEQKIKGSLSQIFFLSEVRFLRTRVNS